jgi:hypothetical protein
MFRSAPQKKGFLPPTEAEREFFSLSAGRDLQASDNESAVRHFFNHLEKLMQPWVEKPNLLNGILDPSFAPHEAPFQRVVRVAYSTASAFKKSPDLSIDRLHQIFSHDEPRVVRSGRDLLLAKQFLFAIMSCLTLLFVPHRDPETGTFSADNQGSAFPSRVTVDMAKLSRPIDELLRSFGETLPRKRKPTGVGHAATRFNVSALNAATLEQLGGVRIAWTDSISSHLDFQFDDTRLEGVLHVFRSPSFCTFWDSENSILEMLVLS